MIKINLRNNILLTNGCFEEVNPEIFYVRLNRKKEFTIEDAKEHAKLIKTLSNRIYKKIGLIVDISKLSSVGVESRKIMAGNLLGEYCKGMALITGSYSSMLLGNMFISFDDPVYPVRACSSFKEAFDWMNGLGG